MKMIKFNPKIRLAMAAVLFLALTVFQANAQLKIGLPTGIANAAAILDASNIAGGNKGFLLPQVALSATGTWTLAGTPTNGMLVFNTTAAGTGSTAVFVGAYYWYNSQWNQVATQTGQTAATFSSGVTCTGTLSGTYQVGVTMTSSNTKVVSATVATAGTYSATTNTVNGVTFSANGTVLTTSTVNFTLTASGTPTASGLATYTVTLGGATCTFDVTYSGAATFACGSATQTQTPSGAIASGTHYTGSYTIPYTNGNGSSYTASTQTVNGLTLTRAAGTYLTGAGGNVVYNLDGTASAAGSATFTIPECTTVTYGDALRAALAAGGCASCSAYDLASNDTWVSITAAEYAQIDNFMTVNIAGKNESLMTSNVTLSNGSNTFVGVGPSAPTLPANNYVVAFSMINAAKTTSLTVTGAAVKYSTSATTGFTTGGPAVKIAASSAVIRVYNIMKKPSAVINVSAASYVAFNSGSSSTNYIGFVPSSDATYDNYCGGDCTNMSTTNYSNLQLFQVKGTVTKQW